MTPTALTNLIQGLHGPSLLQQYFAASTLREIVATEAEFGPVLSSLDRRLEGLVSGRRYGTRVELNDAIQKAFPALQTLVQGDDPRLQHYRDITAIQPRLGPPLFANTSPLQVDSERDRDLSGVIAPLRENLLRQNTYQHPKERPIQKILLRIDGRKVALDEQTLQEQTRRLFGKGISLDVIHAVFQIDVLGYQTSRLDIAIDQDRIAFRGEISTEDSSFIGSFSRMIVRKNSGDNCWKAYGRKFHLGHDKINDQANTKHQQGVGRRSTQRFLSLLQYLGVNYYQFAVDEIGRYAWPRLGYDFADRVTRETVLINLFEYLRDHRIHVTLEQIEKICAIQHSWELANLEIEGQRLGKDFLLDLDLHDQRFQVRFDLTDTYPGWQQLLIPTHWETFPAETIIALSNYFTWQGMMAEVFRSEVIHAKHLLERIAQKLGSIALGIDQTNEGRDTEVLTNDLFASIDFVIPILSAVLEIPHEESEFARTFWEQLNRMARRIMLQMIDWLKEEDITNPAIQAFLRQEDKLRKILGKPI